MVVLGGEARTAKPRAVCVGACTPNPPFPRAPPPQGLNDKDIVALSGAHTLGRVRSERSGWGVAETKYTKEGPNFPGERRWGVVARSLRLPARPPQPQPQA